MQTAIYQLIQGRVKKLIELAVKELELLLVSPN